jgi:two-component system heavy metal sensor histidine kinase CusS
MILILFLISAGALYELLGASLSKQDNDEIHDRVQTIHMLLESETAGRPLLHSRVEREWAQRRFERIYVRILDTDGRVVTETPAVNLPEKLFDSVAPSEEDSKIKTVYLDSGVFLVGRFQVITSDAQHFILQIALDRSNEARLIATFFKQSIPLVLVIVLIGCFILSRVIVRKALQPVEDISRGAAKVNSETLKERISLQSLPIELHELARTLNKMLDRLEESFQRLSRFSDDISHELRTPVNNLMGAFSVALGRHRSIEEYESILGSGIEDCERIKRIIEALLFISKAQDPAQSIAREPIFLTEEVKKILGFYEVLAQEAGLEIVADIQAELTIRAERTLFQRAIGNLLSNAIRHSPVGSTVKVRISKNGESAIVEVIDQGHGIDSVAMTQIGQRFFRVDPSRAQASGGSGLGLSIVKSIVHLHQGKFEIQSEIDKGTIVRLIFEL